MSTTQHAQISRLRQSVKRVAIAFIGAVALAEHGPAILAGEDGPREIPKDGSWVRYEVWVEKLNKEEKYPPIAVTLSFVGTVVEDGRTYRWVEKKSVVPEGVEGTGTTVEKALVPETDLWESDMPFEHVRRAWVRRPNEQAAEIPAQRLVAITDGLFFGVLLWTPGMLKKAGTAANESKDIEYQRGRLMDAVARTGKRHDQRSAREKIEKTYIAWQHSDLPLGAAEVKITSEWFINRQKTPQRRISYVYRIQDFGTDAKSMLPENN